MVAASAFGDVTCLENFEGLEPGTVPEWWAGSGGERFGVVAGANHTGISSPWATPDFGAGGSQALALVVGAGAGIATAGFSPSSGNSGAFVLNFSMMHQSGLAGTLGIRIFGGAMGPDTALTTYEFD